MSEEKETVNVQTQQDENQAGVSPTEVDGQGSKGGDSKAQRGGPSGQQAAMRIQQKMLDRLEAMEEKLNSFSIPQKAQETPVSNDATDFWSNPTESIAKTVNGIVAERLAEERLSSQRQQALDYIRSQDGVLDTAEDETDLVALMKENRLDKLAEKFPVEAAQLAVKLFQAERGMSKNGSQKAAEAQAAGIRGGGTGKPGGPKVWSRADIKGMSLEEWKKNKEDIMKADKEGRIE